MPRNSPVRPRNHFALALGVILVGLSGLLPVRAQQTPEAKGLAIATEMDKRDLGWGDASTEMKMVLRNSEGESSSRELRFISLEVNGNDQGDKSLSVFDRPRDIEGTALLSHTKIVDADDQWLYLPSLKRVKRISSANKSGPFMGSEFAYEDLVSQEVAKFTYTWLRDEACGEDQCFVVERHPVYKNSGYTRQIVWIDQTAYRLRRADFYDRKNSLLKTLAYSDYRQYLDHYWRPHTLTMENLQNGKSTTLTYADYRFQVGLSDSDFTPGRLKRAR